MTVSLLVWVLTAVAALVIVLTRLRLRNPSGSGQFAVSSNLLLAHTVSGALALVLWVAFLLGPADSVWGSGLVGIVAVALWWVVALCGLTLLLRWLPSKGRHAPESSGDGWGSGPGLSLLAHLSMAAAVVVFTYAYLTSAV